LNAEDKKWNADKLPFKEILTIFSRYTVKQMNLQR